MENVLFCSGGKDSVATAIIAKEKGEPLDGAVFVEVMFDEKTSGEHPLHIEFIYDKVKPFFGNELKVPFKVLRSDRTYVDFFMGSITRGENKGRTRGFPLPGMCAINRDCKMRPIRQFIKRHEVKTEYVGIAADEPKRLARLNGNKVSLLAKYGLTEADAKAKCKEYGLLSPIYSISKRNGCWFCMNCKDNEFVWLLKNRPDLFDRLCELEQEFPQRMRKCINHTETPCQIRNRLEVLWRQISFFD